MIFVPSGEVYTVNMARPALSRRRIAAAAVAVADADGLPAVTTRRVGTELGVSAMALYRHVAGRQGLLEVTAALAAERTRVPPAPDDDWRAGLIALAESGRRAFAAHPWLLALALGPDRALDLTPPETTERLLELLGAAGLGAEEAADALLGAAAIPVGVAALTGAGAPSADAASALDVSGAQGDAPSPARAALHARGLTADVGLRVYDLTLAAYLDGVDRRVRGEAPRTTLKEDP